MLVILYLQWSRSPCVGQIKSLKKCWSNLNLYVAEISTFVGYPLVMTNIAIEHDHTVEIVDFPIKNGDFP